VTGNSATAGGGIDIVRGSLTLDNTDVTNNTALAFTNRFPQPCPAPPHVQPGSGGGIGAAGTPFVGANITLKGDSDITGNTAQPGADCNGDPLPGEGGGIDRSGTASTVTFDSWTGEISGNSPGTDQCNPDLTLPDSSVCQ
jgi:hypothetical protein